MFAVKITNVLGTKFLDQQVGVSFYVKTVGGRIGSLLSSLFIPCDSRGIICFSVRFLKLNPSRFAR